MKPSPSHPVAPEEAPQVGRSPFRRQQGCGGSEWAPGGGCGGRTDDQVATPGNPALFPEPPRAPREVSYCRVRRSEEHTSELQSLMRISYAVFCLKKKKK